MVGRRTAGDAHILDLGPELLALVASNLRSTQLVGFRGVCTAFGFPEQTVSSSPLAASVALERSVAEEGARLQLLALPPDVQAKSGRHEGRCNMWTRRLAELEKYELPLRFTRAPEGISIAGEGGSLAQHVTRSIVGGRLRSSDDQWRDGSGTAICAAAPMWAGVHYAEFTLVRSNLSWVGVCEAECPANKAAINTAGGWGYFAAFGHLCHNRKVSAWEGMKAMDEGDTVGLQLDFTRGRGGELTCYKNGERLGVLCSGLCGGERPLCWFTSVYNRGAVRVRWRAAPATTPTITPKFQKVEREEEASTPQR